MKNPILYLVLFMLAACSSNDKKDEKTVTDSTSTPDTLISVKENAAKLDTLDISFFQNAAYGGMMEVESSEKILAVTKNADIKAFANMMVSDHGGANQKLKVLAESKGYVLPASLPNSKVELIGKIDSFKEEARNEYYLQLMVKEHQNAIGVFSVASRSNDAAINQFAKGVLPTLNHHYMKVKKLDSLLKVPKANQGDDLLKLSDRKK